MLQFMNNYTESAHKEGTADIEKEIYIYFLKSIQY